MFHSLMGIFAMHYEGREIKIPKHHATTVYELLLYAVCICGIDKYIRIHTYSTYINHAPTYRMLQQTTIDKKKSA